MLVAALATACGSSDTQTASTQPAASASASKLAPIHGKYSPTIDPANFVTTIDTRYFPLLPGLVRPGPAGKRLVHGRGHP
jgi:hypothetical protein